MVRISIFRMFRRDDVVNIGRFKGFHRHRILPPLLVVFVTAVVLLAYSLWFSHQQAIQAAQTNVRNLAWLTEARWSASLDRARSSLDNLAGKVRPDAMRQAELHRYEQYLNTELTIEGKGFPEIKAFHVFGADGGLMYTSEVDDPWRLNMTEASCFRKLREDPRQEIAYSGVMRHGADQVESFMVLLPLRAANGVFLGALGAQIDLAYFERLLGSLDVGGRGFLAIWRSDDFSLVLRRPPLPPELARRLPADHPVRGAIAGGMRDGVVRAPAYVDGLPRILGVRVLINAPFYVVAGLAEDEVLASWRTKRLVVVLVGLLLLVVLWLMRGLLKHSESSLARAIDQAQSAEERLKLMASVYEHTSEAILVTDAAKRIVSINRAFTTLTGYALADVQGRNPSLLSAGRTSPEEYAEMWRAIDESGAWQGEIWDRRKDGGCYPKWLAISTLRNAEGVLTHYIGSFTDISDRKQAEQRIHELAHNDVLTGLANRFSLDQRLAQAIVAARRENRQLAVMFIDLDRFKAINDTLGHPVGDQLLRDVAKRLRACVRASDIVARLGGDEFVVVMTDLTDAVAHAVPLMAGKIVRQLSRTHRIDGHELRSTPSIGIAVLPSDGEDVGALMKAADTAMYHAKSQGRANYQFFTAAMNKAAAERLQLENALRQALERDEFRLHFQPQIDIASGAVVAVEALIRWQSPTMGLVPPDTFIPLAEEVGLIEGIGRWVLEQAGRECELLVAGGYPGIRVAVNLSMRQLRKRDIVAIVRRVLQDNRIAPGQLELEVTETVTMEAPETTIGVLGQLRALGVLLSVDDFGIGYSSLARLKLLPIHGLKLDRTLVGDIETDANDAAICAAAIAMAHSLGLKVVAEGVETEAQLEHLRRLGCDLAQGYHFSRPLPVDELNLYLERSRQGAAPGAPA